MTKTPELNFKYYYPTYRPIVSKETSFRIKTGTIGHIVGNDDSLLCGQEKAQEKSLTSYTVKNYAMPGISLCDDCVNERADLTNPKRIKELELLEKWKEATKNRVSKEK